MTTKNQYNQMLGGDDKVSLSAGMDIVDGVRNDEVSLLAELTRIVDL